MKITAAKMRNKNFLSEIQVPQYSMLAFDKAYNYYKQFNEWTEKKIYFDTRQKSNAVYCVLKKVSEAILPKKQAGVLKKEQIEVSYKVKMELITLMLRRICYQGEKGRQSVFIGNDFIITAKEIALICKKRWGIDLLFKKMN
jgi:IS4 transposase